MKLFSDNQGRVFHMTRDGYACYMTKVCTLPHEYEEASPAAAKQYRAAHTHLWATVQKYTPFAYFVLTKKMRYRGDADDMVHDHGIPTLMRCAEKWDVTLGTFMSYAYVALIRAYDAAWKSKDPELVYFEGQYTTHVELETRDLVQYIMEGLSDYDRELFQDYYGRGLTQEEMSKKRGIARATVNLHIKTALLKARKLLWDSPSMMEIFKSTGP